MVTAYTSAQDGFSAWPAYVNEGSAETRIKRSGASTTEQPSVVLTSLSGGHVGLNKGFQALKGRVEFEYQVISSASPAENITMFVIPMQRPGLPEVGTTINDDPRNGFSKFRVKFVMPRITYGDGMWHQQSLDFDFSATPTANFVVVGPRLNEGSVAPAAAQVIIRNLRVSIPARGSAELSTATKK